MSHKFEKCLSRGTAAGVIRQWLTLTALLLPVTVFAQGEPIHIALFASFPPMAYQDPETGKLAGIDVALANYIGVKLHRPVVWQDVSYEAAVPALTTGRVDLALSMLDEPASRDKLDYSDYLKSGIQAYALKTHAPIDSLLALCGQTVGANRRNGFSAIMRQWSTQHCLPAGKPAMAVRDAEGTQMARLDLKQHRVDAIVQSSESVPYIFSQEPGTYIAVGEQLPSSVIAIAYPKGADLLRKQVDAALRDAVADGTYERILTQYHLTANSASAEIRASH